MEVSEGTQAGARVPFWPEGLSRPAGRFFTKKLFSDFFADPAGLAHVNSNFISYLRYSLIKTLLRLIRLWVSLW